MKSCRLAWFLVAASAAWAAEPPRWATKDLRAGIIGTDTSHVPAFTSQLHRHSEWRIKVVAAFKAGSPDLPASADRVEGFAKTVQEKYGVEIVDRIKTLLAKVDVVLLESVDGRPHLAQAETVKISEFMTAAEVSKQRNGADVSLQELRK